MSDSLALSNTITAKMAGGEIEIKRYADLFKNTPSKEPETAEQVVARFDKLRRR